jgi:hypothetical protein
MSVDRCTDHSLDERLVEEGGRSSFLLSWIPGFLIELHENGWAFR